MSIVAIDLGKSKSVVCVLEGLSGGHRFEAIPTTPSAVLGVLERQRPERVVIETGPMEAFAASVLILEPRPSQTPYNKWAGRPCFETTMSYTGTYAGMRTGS